MERCAFVSTAKSKTMSVPYTIEICAAAPGQCVVFEHKEHFSGLCRNGCKNFGRKWSCPPFSPAFSTISAQWSKLYILYMRMPMNGFSGIKNEYLRIKAANSMLKSRADHYMRRLAEDYGRYISTGSCRRCKPCKLQSGERCAHPLSMAYSFEALGIDVGALIDVYFGHPLLWYRKHAVPDYTSVVCGLLTNEDLPLELLERKYFEILGEPEYIAE